MLKKVSGRTGVVAIVSAAFAIASCPLTVTAKDLPAPVNARCDAKEIGSPAWQVCLRSGRGAASDQKLFYAGYWLAKSGAFEKALGYLNKVRTKNERVLTYIGFALRKLGRVDEAMASYEHALSLKPDYVVARAYLGEALIVQGDLDGAEAELRMIASVCGTSCAEHNELAAQLASHRNGPN